MSNAAAVGRLHSSAVAKLRASLSAARVDLEKASGKTQAAEDAVRVQASRAAAAENERAAVKKALEKRAAECTALYTELNEAEAKAVKLEAELNEREIVTRRLEEQVAECIDLVSKFQQNDTLDDSDRVAEVIGVLAATLN